MTDSIVVAAPGELKDAGMRSFYAGQYPQAIESFESAQRAFAVVGDEGQAAEMLNNLGVVYQRLARWDDAIRALTEASAIFARLNLREQEAQATGNLGSLLISRGERKRGMGLLQEAVGMFRALGKRELQSTTLRALSRAHMGGGDF